MASGFEETIIEEVFDYSLDSWWRHHFKIPYGSKSHRESSIIDMMVDYADYVNIEYVVYEDVIKKIEEEKLAQFTPEEETDFLKQFGLD